MTKIKDFQFFIMFFLFSLAIGFFVQLILFPIILPHLHYGEGLMAGRDWVQFHLQAKETTSKMHEVGITSWNLRFQEGKTGITGILSIVYFIFSAKPIYFLFLNAIMYAGSIILLYKTFCNSQYSYLTLLVTFFMLPSTLILYTQVHNDLFILLALACYFYAIKIKTSAKSLFFVFFSYLLIWIVRPYLLAPLVTFFSIRIILELEFKKILTLLIISFLSFGIFHKRETVTMNVPFNKQSEVPFNEQSEVQKNIRWTYSSVLPIFLENKFYQLALYRDSFNATKTKSNSSIDADVSFHSSLDVLKYAPRALFVSLFSPFPSFWVVKSENNESKSSGIERLAASVEMFWFYLVYLVFFITFLKAKPSKDSIKNILVLALFLILLGTVVSNMGTLYRMRMPYFLILQVIFLEKIFSTSWFGQRSLS